MRKGEAKKLTFEKKTKFNSSITCQSFSTGRLTAALFSRLSGHLFTRMLNWRIGRASGRHRTARTFVFPGPRDRVLVIGRACGEYAARFHRRCVTGCVDGPAFSQRRYPILGIHRVVNGT